MPKKISSVIFVALLLGFFVSTASARTPVETNSAVREEVKQRIDEKQERVEAVKTEVREARDANVEARQDKTTDRRGALAKLHGNRLENRFGFYGKRLGALIERIQARLNTLKDSGKNTDAPQKTLDSAKAELQKAQVAANNAVVLFQIIPEGEGAQRKVALEKAKESAELARTSFMTVHKLLAQVIREVKAL